MEKFIFLFRGGETHPDNANDSKEAMEYIQSWIVWMQDLGQKGILTGGDSLHRVGKQVIGIDKEVNDLPYVVGKEMVNGYLIVNAKDIDAAVEISKGCPIFVENGKVEIRPIQAQGS